MIGGLKPYRHYQDTGHDWLGSVPSHWSLLRAKRLFREVDERSKTGKEELLSVSHLTGVTPRRLKNVTMFMAESNVGHKVCRPGDLVINTLWAWMAALGVTRHEGIVSPAYGVYRPTEDGGILPAYADHLLRTPLYAAEYQRRSTGINSSRLRLYPEQFLRIPVMVPPPDEQAAIVRFLDWANGRLERAIRAKRKVIALLTEQKQAIVRRAVTRGMDPTTPLKPTGIPWLGDVPQHWSVRKLRSLFQTQGSGTTPSGENYYDGSINWVMSGDLNDAVVWKTKRKVNSQALTAYSTLKLYPPNSVAVAMYGATIGKTAILGESACTNQACCVFAEAKTGVNVRVVQLILQATRPQLLREAYGGGQPNINAEVVRSLRVPFPPFEEQSHILLYVEQETNELGVAMTKLEREVELLREYRVRLVADVVTGKLDVREAVAQLPKDVAVGVAAAPEDEVGDPDFTDEEDTEA